jgi:hypothetical protein
MITVTSSLSAINDYSCQRSFLKHRSLPFPQAVFFP